MVSVWMLGRSSSYIRGNRRIRRAIYITHAHCLRIDSVAPDGFSWWITLGGRTISPVASFCLLRKFGWRSNRNRFYFRTTTLKMECGVLKIGVSIFNW